MESSGTVRVLELVPGGNYDARLFKLRRGKCVMLTGYKSSILCIPSCSKEYFHSGVGIEAVPS